MQGKQDRSLTLANMIFKIKHIKGKDNKVADALSRNEITSSIASISSYKTKLDDKLEEGIKLDTEYQNLREKSNSKCI